MRRETRPRRFPEPNETMLPSGLSGSEDRFLRNMNQIKSLQKSWDAHCKNYVSAMQSKFHDHPQVMFDHRQKRQQFIDAVKQILIESGGMLGFNPRFDVVLKNDEELIITPRNGSGQRMMTRYECLETMRELGRD